MTHVEGTMKHHASVPKKVSGSAPLIRHEWPPLSPTEMVGRYLQRAGLRPSGHKATSRPPTLLLPNPDAGNVASATVTYLEAGRPGVVRLHADGLIEALPFPGPPLPRYLGCLNVWNQGGCVARLLVDPAGQSFRVSSWLGDSWRPPTLAPVCSRARPSRLLHPLARGCSGQEPCSKHC